MKKEMMKSHQSLEQKLQPTEVGMETYIHL